MARITFTPNTVKMSREYEMSPEELAFVDMVACGWERRDAYIIAMHTGENWTAQAIDRACREVLSRLTAKRRIGELRTGGASTEEDDDVDLQEGASKENMLRELIQAKKRYKLGSKEWLEISKMIADITRMKQEEVQIEDKTVHFYLPLTCSRCRLYNEHNKK